MRIRLLQTLICGALCVAPCSAGAGESLTYEFKLRTGASHRVQDGLRKGTLGLGMNVGLPTRLGTCSIELGYHYKTGDSFLNGLNTPAAGMAALNLEKSFDRRKNELAGLALRISLERPMPALDAAWQVGLMLGGTTFKHDVQADMQSVDWKPVTTQPTPALWRDTYTQWDKHPYLGVSPFVGFRVPLTPQGKLELNAMLLNYQAVSYAHVPGSSPSYSLTTTDVKGKVVGPLSAHNDFPGDRLVKTRRFVPVFEIGYAFQF